MATQIRYISYHGKSLALATDEVVGSDHLVLFLHGLGCAKESFEPILAGVGLREFSKCAVDFPGFGTSDKPQDLTYMLEEHAAIIELLVEQLAPAKLSIVAHSMGGAIGVLLAQKLGQVEHFINIEGNLVAEDCGLVSRSLAGQSLEEFMAFGSAKFSSGLSESPRTDLRAWAVWYEQASPYALHESAKSLVEWSDSGKLLETFNGFNRKAYIYGDEDPKDFLLPKLKNTQIHKITDAGHFSMVDKPAELASAIADALAKN